MKRRAPGEFSGLYSGQRWQDLRRITLRRDNFACQMCGALLRGGRSDDTATILRPAVIDHLIPHRGDAVLFADRKNLWSICCDCHDGPCQSIEARRGLRPDQIRAAKISHKVPTLDGTSSRPPNRWVDSEYPDARLMTW